MLKKANRADILRYGEQAYALALDPTTSSYPTYADGIKTKEDFFRAAERSVDGGMSELWLFFSEEKVEGWISFFWEESEKYLQLTGFQLARYKEEVLAELLSMLEERFGGYTAYFGFPAENRAVIDWLGKGGFTCIERSWNHSFFFDGIRRKDMATRSKGFFGITSICFVRYTVRMRKPIGRRTGFMMRSTTGWSL